MRAPETVLWEIQRRATEKRYGTDVASSRKRCVSLFQFIREAWHVVLPDVAFIEGWHIEELCRHLEAMTRGEYLARGLQNRLLVNIPPGSMKSLTVAVFWPAWEWTQHPHLQFIATSFREETCKRDARRFRMLVVSKWYQDRWPVEITTQGDLRTANTSGGWRETMPFGSLQNQRGDRVILDDPHSIDTAESDADRQSAAIRFRESASLRLNDPASSAIVVIMQRLHQQDISGIIEEMKLPYVHLMLPMRFEPERECRTPFGGDRRKIEGELLFPERFPLTVVERDEATIGSHAVAGQFQQRPSPRGGLIFKREWFSVVEAAPGDCKWVRGWDLASSEKSTAAYTVGLLLGYQRSTRTYFVASVVRARVSNPEAIIVSTATQDSRSVEISIPQDPGAGGKILARSLVGALSGYNAYCSPESADKETRALPVAAQAQAGNIRIVRGAWNAAFLDEVETFPAGYKDQIDALSRAFAHHQQNVHTDVVAPIFVSAPRRHFGDHPGY